MAIAVRATEIRIRRIFNLLRADTLLAQESVNL
jgi:hypothetical protein